MINNLTKEEVNGVLKQQGLTLEQLLNLMESNLRIMGEDKQEESHYWIIKLHYHKIYRKHCE